MTVYTLDELADSKDNRAADWIVLTAKTACVSEVVRLFFLEVRGFSINNKDFVHIILIAACPVHQKWKEPRQIV